MSQNLLIYILFLHFLADFVFQTDNMAKRKSKEWLVLLEHIAVYGAVLFAGLSLWPLTWGASLGTATLWIAIYVLLNAAIHFAVDAITSRINSRLYASGRIHAFFVGIGADQFIHAATLILTLPILVW